MAIINGNLSTENVRTIKELILDEQKLVTYLTLSKDLCIHVNEAKTLLKKVIDEIKENNASIPLNITFLISGLTNNNAGLTTVCLEPELETRKNTFKTIFYQHIYSVSLGSSGVDNATLACIHRFEDILLCAGLIKGTSCIKRSSDEIDTLKSSSQKVVDDVKTVLPLKKDIKERTSDVTQITHKANDVVKIHETKSEPVIKSEVTSPKKNGTSTVNNKTIAKNGTKPSKGIAGFFSKSNSATSTKSAKVAKETIKKTETLPEVKKETPPKIKKEEHMDVDNEIPTKTIKKEPESEKKINKKSSSLSQIKKNAKVDKKRKRVLHVSDSESDEDKDPFAEEIPTNYESDDEILSTPTVNTIKITSGILNPKKRRKLVDKTYTDEEGYILTRKEEVYESCSEEEVDIVKTEHVQIKTEKENVEQINKVRTEVISNEKKTKNIKKKASPPQKGKQANIMNFFKKI